MSKSEKTPEIKRIVNGIYSFGKTGTIVHHPWGSMNAEAEPWRVSWKTWMSETVVKRFRTLNEARKFVKSLH